MTSRSGGRSAEPGYCPRCGTSLRDASGNPPACPGCGQVQWRDPKVATGVLVARAERVLLVRRNHEPGLGLWSFPSGFVDRGEVVEDAAAREALEETGLEVRITGLIGVFSEPGGSVVFVMYEGEPATGGDPVAGPEALEVGFFAPDGLPPLAFAHDARIIERWRAQRGA
jgi:ADP-ribose pyrophosphatase YjhB (NUDIX family)